MALIIFGGCNGLATEAMAATEAVAWGLVLISRGWDKGTPVSLFTGVDTMVGRVLLRAAPTTPTGRWAVETGSLGRIFRGGVFIRSTLRRL